MGDAVEVIGTVPAEAPELVPPELWPDPHPHYHRMRAESPVKAFPEWDEYVCTRWEDCERVLRDPTFSADPSRRRMRTPFLELAEGMERPRSMLMMDPPDHTRLRKLVSKAFTPRTVETHKYEIMRALGFRKTADLVRYATSIGLIQP